MYGHMPQQILMYKKFKQIPEIDERIRGRLRVNKMHFRTTNLSYDATGEIAPY